MKFVLPHYRWGISNIDKIKEDTSLLKSKIKTWVDAGLARIPFNTPAAEVGTKKIKIIFLFDPGGSYPWVEEDKDSKFIFVDILGTWSG